MLNSKYLIEYLSFVIFIFVVSFVSRYSVLFGHYVLDDFVLIVYNRFITDINNIFLLLNPINIFEVLPIRCGARPVTIATLIVDFWVGDLNPFWYHLTNLFLHSINSCLIFSFCYLLKKDISLFPVSSALFFSLHPIQTEVVSVISFRADLLLVFFSLLALNMISFLNIHSIKEVNKKFIFLLVFLFVCFSFFSKENTIVLPIIIFLYLLFFYKKVKYFKYSFYIFFCVSFLFLFFWLERFPVPLFFSFYPNISQNINPLFNFTDYIYTIINSLYYNVLHILYPVDLSVDYILSFSKKIFFITLLFAIAFILSIKFIKDKYIKFSMLSIIVMYLPVSNLVPLVNTLADRYMYYPMIAISFLFGLLVIQLQKVVHSKIIIIILLFLFFLTNIFISYTRCKVYSNQYFLYSDAMTKYSTNIRVLYNMAVAYFDNNEFEKSIEIMNKLIKINPIYNRDKVWYIQALAYEKLNDKDNALKYYQKAFLLSPDNKDLVENFVKYFGNTKETLEYVCKNTTKISNKHILAIQNIVLN